VSVSSAAGFEAGLAFPQNYYSVVAETLSSTADSLQPSAVGLFAAVALPTTVVNQQASLLAPPAVKETPFVVAVVVVAAVAVAAAFAAAAVVVAAVAGAVAVAAAVTAAAAAGSVGVAAAVATAAGNAFAAGRSSENYPLASLVGPL